MDTEIRTIHTFKAGDLFDRHYHLLELVGSGGFADVWKAKDELVDTIVALKIYTRLDKEGISELAREYKDMRGINHPNLLTGNHFDASGNIPYLEMDYCDGGSLVSHVGRMGNDELRHMLRDVCSGLAYLHAEGIVHQDIKPENILLDTKHDRYMLADFGISGKSHSRLSKSAKIASDIVAMTAAYAPPEKLSANPIDRTPSTKGDIFSLGVTLYELATGNLPVDLPQSTGQLLLISQGRQPLYFDNIADPQLKWITECCMCYRKEDRPTAEEVLAMLDNGASEPKNQKKASDSRPPTIEIKSNGGRDPKRPTKPINSNKPEPPRQRPIIHTPTPQDIREMFETMERKKQENKPKIKWGYIAVASLAVLAIVVIALLNIFKTSDTTPMEAPEDNITQTNTNIIPDNFVLCPKGTLLHYKDWDDKNKKEHYIDIHLDSFYISKYELTQEEWNDFVPTIPCNIFDFFSSDINDKTRYKELSGNELPASIGIVYACYYCNKRSVAEGFTGFYYVENNKILLNPKGNGYRLPILYEWVYAARGGENKMTKYAAGDNLNEIAWYGSNSGGIPHNIGLKKPNKIGLYDMNGNVSEWIWSFKNGETDFPFENGGGDYWLYNYNNCFSESRHAWSYKDSRKGIRLVFVPKNMSNNNIQNHIVSYLKVDDNLATLF